MEKKTPEMHVWLWACLLCITLGFAGCRSDKTDSVSGVITLDGVPLEGAGVRFTPVGNGGTVISGFTDAKGKYSSQTLQGRLSADTISNEYVVTVSKYEEYDTGRKIRGEEGVLETVYDNKLITPAVYGDLKKTPFKATVVSGKNTFDFDLKEDENGR